MEQTEIGTNRLLGLYIHIPFCIRKCNYCDFLSAPSSEKQRQEYLEALQKQLKAFGKCLKEAAKEDIIYVIDTVFIGGGTPSLLSVQQMETLMNTVREAFCLSDDAEITMECNPGTVDEEKLRQFFLCGINRLSIGMQSSDDKELKLLGRIHTWEDFRLTFKAARFAGFKNINVDIMGALPGQTVQSYKKTLEKVIALHPEHISAYSLIIEEGTPFFKKYGDEAEKKDSYLQLPSEDEVVMMDELTWKILGEAGYDHYEISNYAIPGKQCQHNLKYWHCEEYLGAGTGAASYIKKDCGLIKKDIGEHFGKEVDDSFVRLKILTDTGEFIKMSKSEKEWSESFCEVELLTKEDEMEEMAFLGLRTKEGVRLDDFYSRFGVTFYDVYKDVLEQYTAMGMMKADKEHASLTLKGMEVANWIMSDFCK